MLRTLYIILLGIHPERFRREFAEEMLWIFDQTASAGDQAASTVAAVALLGDGLRSLATQWMFRAEFEETASAPLPVYDRVPAFYTAGSDMPPASALLNGVALSVLVLGAACAALFYGGRPLRVSTYYSNDFHSGPPEASERVAGPAPERSRTGVAPNAPNAPNAPMASGGARERKSDATAKPDGDDGIWARINALFHKSPEGKPQAMLSVTPATPGAVKGLPGTPPPGQVVLANQKASQAYFARVPILAALDTDHDGVLSEAEIANAPVALAALDTNQDGKLDAEECGMHLVRTTDGKVVTKDGKPGKSKQPDPKRRAQTVQRARFLYMHFQPVLTALDVNHDGMISAEEIEDAADALTALDRNHDGRLTLDEVQPDAAVTEAVAIFNLDTNLDGKISRRERETPFGQHLKSLLDAADRNGDGSVTWEELTLEIRRRSDLDHNGVVTWEEIMKARKAGALGEVPGTKLKGGSLKAE